MNRNGYWTVFMFSSLAVAIFSTVLAIPLCFAACPPLPPPSGNTVVVDTVEEIWNAVNSAVSGDTILVADGTYNLGAAGRYIWANVSGVTIRSLSGNRDGVIFDDNYQGTEVITIAASNVTIADLTIKRARTHAIHVVSSATANTVDTLIYNVRIVDPGQQAIKINPSSDLFFADDGKVACCVIELTQSGREEVYNILQRDEATADLAGNLQSQALSVFADGASGDLHLSETAVQAIDKGAVLAAGLCDDDIDGEKRPGGKARDVGADERTTPRAPIVAPFLLLLFP